MNPDQQSILQNLELSAPESAVEAEPIMQILDEMLEQQPEPPTAIAQISLIPDSEQLSEQLGNDVLIQEIKQKTQQKDSLAKDIAALEDKLQNLHQSASNLQSEIDYLQANKQQILASQLGELQSAIARLTQEALQPLEQRKQELQEAIAVLQRKYDRLQTEMKTIYAGVSQDVAVRVQGFKDYLVGSLQDLVASAEKLDLLPPAPVVVPETATKPQSEPLQLSEQTFGEYRVRIDQILERFRTAPDYYGPAWKLRRTFEQSHSERVSQWFFEQAGRGAIRSMGTRLQNILVAAAATSILRSLHGEKLRVLILATSPERLGEWRRGFQDCLGISREQFGPEKGVVLFEDADPLSLKGDRLVQEKQMPLVIIDEAEELIAVDLMRFPLLIAFGRDPQAKSGYASGRDKDYRNGGWDF